MHRQPHLHPALLLLICSLASACTTPRALPAGSMQNDVGGSGLAYSITVPSQEWSSVDDATLKASGADIQMVRMAESGWLIARGHPGATLDEIVPNRRAALLANGASNYTERRYFLATSDMITASLARYVLGRDVVLVITAVQPPYAVEIMTGTSRASGVERELIEILESVRFNAAENES